MTFSFLHWVLVVVGITPVIGSRFLPITKLWNTPHIFMDGCIPILIWEIMKLQEERKKDASRPLSKIRVMRVAIPRATQENKGLLSL
jgi:hypothetical protein